MSKYLGRFLSCANPETWYFPGLSFPLMQLLLLPITMLASGEEVMGDAGTRYI